MNTILLIHGPNLNRLGTRDPEIYGSMNLHELEESVSAQLKQIGYGMISFQSNHEGELIDCIQQYSNEVSGLIINPGAFSHYSYALHDAIVDCKPPTIEVHLSDIKAREPWRAHSVVAPACLTSIYGKHIQGYFDAVDILCGQANFVIGNPIKHSLSPSFHGEQYKTFGIQTKMIPLENPNLARLAQIIRTNKTPLTAVTLPFKSEILKYVDQQTEAVKTLGAANTLIFKNNQLEAHNTDVTGILLALDKVKLEGQSILILGAGGSARALGYALQGTQANLYWHNRSADKAQALANLFGGTVITNPDQDFDLIINTTPIGMLEDESPLEQYAFNANQIVFDFIYTPRETKLLRAAAQAGAQCISGETMFQSQALKQIELCYGVSP